MNKKIIITDIILEETGQNTRLSCLVSNGRLIEVRCECPDRTTELGNIYIGKVQKISGNIHAAFIEISPGFACYYPLVKKKEPIYIRKMPSPQMVQGDEVLVQVQKESVKTKAPTVSTNLNLTGRYVVLTSEKKQIGFSAKFDEPTREHFKALMKENYHAPYGLIVRTNARDVSDEEVLAEIEQLAGQFDKLIKNAKTRTCFSCVYQAKPKYMSYIQNIYQEGIEEIITDNPEIFAEIEQYRQQYIPLLQIPLRLYDDPLLPLAKLYNLERQISRALSKKVWLKSGGYLVIEPTEALTVIDVNTGKSVSKKEPETHFLNINLEAASEIAFQLRIRNISGIVIIDFIDLSSKEDRGAVMEHLKEAVKNDPVPVNVHDMTKLNLLELTRKKIEKSLMEQLT